jgi:hypothetical protein
MEEILASIRRIISDDGEGAEQARSQGEATPQASDAEDQAADADIAAMLEDAAAETVADEDAAGEAEPAAEDVLDLTDDMAAAGVGAGDDEAEPEPEPPAGDSEPVLAGLQAGDVEFADIKADEPEEPEPQPAPPPRRSRQPDKTPASDLLSPEAQATASAAFGALASTMLSHSGGARTLEQIVEDLLRPLLKAWLDENLPPLVEKMVREEIERVARRAR